MANTREEAKQRYQAGCKKYGNKIENARRLFKHVKELDKDQYEMLDDESETILINVQLLSKMAVHAMLVDRFTGIKGDGWAKDDHFDLKSDCDVKIENGDYLILCHAEYGMTYTSSYKIVYTFDGGWLVLGQPTDIEFALVIDQTAQYEADTVYYALKRKAGCDDDDDYFD